MVNKKFIEKIDEFTEKATHHKDLFINVCEDIEESAIENYKILNPIKFIVDNYKTCNLISVAIYKIKRKRQIDDNNSIFKEHFQYGDRIAIIKHLFISNNESNTDIYDMCEFIKKCRTFILNDDVTIELDIFISFNNMVLQRTYVYEYMTYIEKKLAEKLQFAIATESEAISYKIEKNIIAEQQNKEKNCSAKRHRPNKEEREKIFNSKWGLADPEHNFISKNIIRIEREIDNKNKNTFDFVKTELVLYGEYNDPKIKNWIRCNHKKIIKCILKDIENNRSYKKYGIPINYLKPTVITHRHDNTLWVTFELRTKKE